MASINYTTSSDKKTASAQIMALPGALCGIDVQAPSSGQTTLYVYDSENSSLSGKKIIAEVIVDAGFGGMQHEYFMPAVVNRGIYVDMVGTDASYIVRFIAG